MDQTRLLSRIEAASVENASDIQLLFTSNECLNHCSCTWFLQAVKQYHANSPAENWDLFYKQIETQPKPIGLVGYDKSGPAAWCAIGPRSRFFRVLKTPTYNGRDSSEDEKVWLVPCFFTKPGLPKIETMAEMLQAATEAAKLEGAIAVEGIPFAGDKLQSSGDTQVGLESVFASVGFEVVKRPSANRVLMRLALL